MKDTDNIRISITLSLESYEYLTEVCKTKKRQTIFDEAINLHKNSQLARRQVEFLMHEIRCIQMDLEGKKELLSSLNNRLEVNPSELPILYNFLENMLSKLNVIIKSINP
jgi:hypothetical protein